ncbi:MAG: hypothetical protein ACYTHM_24280 [Planctomycetota bacterium]|jgi:hypothetical protein
MEEKARKSEGHRIDYFIHAMRKAGCRFNSGQQPVFRKRGTLEFWEGEFFYRPGQIGIVGKVTLDHNFITVKLTRILPRKVVNQYREELHLLMTTNQCHYYFEPVPGDEENLFVVLAKYIYASEPPEDEVQVVLDMVSHGALDLQKAVVNKFTLWKPKNPI